MEYINFYRKAKEAPKPPLDQESARRLDRDGVADDDDHDDVVVSRVRHESVEDLTQMDERRRQRGQRGEGDKAVKRTPSAHESKTSEYRNRMSVAEALALKQRRR